MSAERNYVNLIQEQLNQTAKHNNVPEGLAYQLGFLQGFLARQMVEKPELIGEFKRQVRSTLSRQGR